MQQVKKNTKATRQQLDDMGQAHDTGRQIFLTALNLLTDIRATYDREPDETKTLLTKTISPKLYLDADPDGAVSVTHADPADPFATVLDAARALTDTSAPSTTTADDTSRVNTRYGPWQTQHGVEGDSLPWETIALNDPPTNKADGSNKPCLVGVAGFEPTAPRSQSECATKLRHTPLLPTRARHPDQRT